MGVGYNIHRFNFVLYDGQRILILETRNSMDIIKRYGDLIKKKMADSPAAGRRLIDIGLHYETFMKRHFADKALPRPYADLNVLALKSMLAALEHPENTAWVNLFTPVEILQNFGINCLSIEMMASFLGGFGIEDWFINQSEADGMAPTLCSYHKCFVGAVDSGLMPPAAAAVTTSTVCDGNVQTFRRAATACRVPLTILDIPNEISPMAIAYVVEQLRHFIAELEDLCHRPFDRAALQAALDRENRSFAAYDRFLAAQRGRYYPSTLTIQMFNLFASHLAIGTPEILHFYEALERDVVSRPAFDGKTIFWIHLLPFYQETLKGYFNLSRDYQIQACDMNLDYNRPLDPARPLESLAKKMLGNIFVGPIERRIAAEKALIAKTGADGVIEFCHWGCKQMAGGAGLMKEAFKAEGIPTLVIDGDGIDRRNSHNGQIKTRLEAFFEML